MGTHGSIRLQKTVINILNTLSYAPKAELLLLIVIIAFLFNKLCFYFYLYEYHKINMSLYYASIKFGFKSIPSQINRI